jgi:hypothetical protein
MDGREPPSRGIEFYGRPAPTPRAPRRRARGGSHFPVPQADELPIPLQKLGVRRLGHFGPVELGASESLGFLRIRYGALPAETTELPAPPLRDQPSQLGILVVREIKKRRLRAPFLALKQQRHERRQQRQRGRSDRDFAS